jgi:hypothetical protein
MRAPTIATLLLMLSLCGGTARATEPPTVAVPTGPLYVDDVRLPRGAGGLAWKQVSDTTTGAERVQEFIPAAEAADGWSQIITVKVLPLARDPKAVVGGTVDLMRRVCGRISVINTAHSRQIGESDGIGVSLPVFDEIDTLVTCRDPDIAKLHIILGSDRVTLRRYEVTWYKMMKGRTANYIVQRAWHGDAIDGESLLGSPAVLDEWKAWMTRVTLTRHRME